MQAKGMALKLEDIRQQTLTEITSICSGCDPSLLSITERIFRCFPGSESAVIYRAVLHETYQISSPGLEKIIARWVSSGRAIVVQSLVLQAQQSCPIVVANVNDAECRISSPPGDSGGAQSASNSVAVIVGGTIGAMLGIVLLVGLMIVTIVITIVIVNHEQAMARLKYEFPSPSLYLRVHAYG